MTNFLPLYNSEYDLAKALIRKENRAFQLFYDRFSGKLLAICSRYISDRMAAEDVMVEGIMKVFEKVGQFSFSGSFEGWVKRLIVNEALMFLRSKKMFDVDISQAIEICQNIDFDTDFELEELIEMINELPIGYRTVFNLYVIEGYSHAEISGMLGISEGTSKSQLSRARMILQEKLKKKELSNSIY